MSEQHFAETAGLGVYELTEADIEKLETLRALFIFQNEALEEDAETRSQFVITEAEYRQLLEDAKMAKASAEKEHQEMMARFDRMRPPNEKRRVPTISPDMEAMRAVHKSQAENLAESFLPEGVSLSELKEAGCVGDFNFLTQRMYQKRYEVGSWELLNRLHEENLASCDACFTTSQEGSHTATKASKADPKYDSIYYLWKLSNGTSLCQRFKRNRISPEGLEGVIQPLAGLALFVDGDGYELNAGEYTDSEVSSTPKVGLSLYEYFVKGLGKKIIQGELDTIQIPDIVEVSPDGVTLRETISNKAVTEDTTWPFIEIHEGTEVNRVIK